ncbi:MAG TPA: DUF296 domain-containing protein [Aggregatilineales bacterium]|nr:DUF296 domain-containing protein [Anaerolineales bacterium]HRE46236.1 DUF296 domain-containing protein [Aggregatilineales bacterium]
MGTLTAGVELIAALSELARALDVRAGTCDLLGGLTGITFTSFDMARQTRYPPLTLTDGFEIAAGHTTISRLNNAPHIHTHLLVTYRDPSAPNNTAYVGGHVVQAAVFAVEYTLTVYDGVGIERRPHAASGLALWDVPPLDTAGESPYTVCYIVITL